MTRNNELFNIAKTLQRNDVILVTNKMKAYEETYSARISSIEFDDGVFCITFVPCHRPDSIQCGHGVRFIMPIANDSEKSPFGWQSIIVVGTEQPQTIHHWQPKPGDRGYDLMC